MSGSHRAEGGKPCRYLGAVGIVCAKVLRQECVEVSEQ